MTPLSWLGRKTSTQNQQMTYWNIFLMFPRKQVLTFYANCLQWRQFAWNVKSCFLGNIRKIPPICLLLSGKGHNKTSFSPEWGLFNPQSVSECWHLIITICGQTHRGSTYSFLLLWFRIAIEPSNLFHCSFMSICVLLWGFTDEGASALWPEGFGFDPWLGHTKDFKNGTSCSFAFRAQH